MDHQHKLWISPRPPKVAAKCLLDHLEKHYRTTQADKNTAHGQRLFALSNISR